MTTSTDCRVAPKRRARVDACAVPHPYVADVRCTRPLGHAAPHWQIAAGEDGFTHVTEWPRGAMAMADAPGAARRDTS